MTGDFTSATLLAAIADWAVDTAIWTAVLIAVVLMLRRPIARLFGPRVAYALWLLPLMRFVLPPIVLPAWMKPVENAPTLAATAAPAAYDPAAVTGAAVEPMAQPLVDWSLVADGAVALWLVGAIAFLAWRLACYRAMTRHLMAGARPVGEAGSIRLVESDCVSAPVAFGVRRRVIALPTGFMAHEDIAARDLAIAHEIAHHRGHDLAANLVAQPLLALHWFNPLAWAGWRAMRRDQEAACDARVMIGRSHAERARYGEVIAACSREKNLTPHHKEGRFILAAPMAGFREIGPVLGEKAIVHRLRSLGMTTTTRRHRAGLALLGAASLLALAATASVTYAEDAAQSESASESASDSASEPAEKSVHIRKIVRTDVPASDADGAAPEAKIHMIVKDEKGEFAWHSDGKPMSAEEEARLAAEIERASAEADRASAVAERAGAAVERAMASQARALAEAERLHKRHAFAFVGAPEVEERVSADGRVRTVRVFQRRDGGQRELIQEVIVDEKKIERDAIASAITGIERARAVIAKDSKLSADTRAEVLAELDDEIADLRTELKEHQ